jgi:hypothetical protein
MSLLQNNPRGSHVVLADDVGFINQWDIDSTKKANIPHWTYIKAFPEDSLPTVFPHTSVPRT